MDNDRSTAQDREDRDGASGGALVVLSGGQDSTTCLYWSLDRFGADSVLTITFDYGQRHRVELVAAEKVAEHAGVQNEIIPINTFPSLAENALTDHAMGDVGAVDSTTDLPNTFVPGRNLIFLTCAAAYAYSRGIRHLVTGVAQTDYSGYPDCRQETMHALENALNLGMETTFTLHTPLMNLSKKETVLLARDLGALPALAYSHTCYLGQRPPCGRCPACLLRAKGFQEAGIDDPLILGMSR
ncbi:MAG: 7-cyano-7-deazaguanine synthase QueC [Magnetococcales bacterium]|nr:7-cyano-7-deazaguanine synthase QueC [Magnetococcales bacterium]